MPYGDDKHQLIYTELLNILGEEFVDDDPAIVEAWYRDYVSPAEKGRAEFIVLPSCTEDIQKILQLANRYDFPVSVSGNSQSMETCNAVVGHPYWCFIDPKRMNTIEIDADNGFAIVGPYVTIAQLQAEAMQHGFFHPITCAGTQATALGQNVFTQVTWTGWRTGQGRSILGVEWVLPSGEVMHIGSLTNPKAGWFWGEGPGPDARGVLRGIVGHLGTLGIITKMAIKLHPWPGPKVWPTSGVQPEKECLLPEDIFKTFIISFPTLQKAIDAICEMGKAEIAGFVVKYTAFDLVSWRAPSVEEFWKEWRQDYWVDQNANKFIVLVGLWGFAGPKQVLYEEKVLRQIVKEQEGEFAPSEIQDRYGIFLSAGAVRDTYHNRVTRFGTGVIPGGTFDSLYDALRSGPVAVEMRKKYTPPLLEMGDDFRCWTIDFGHEVMTGINSLAERCPETSQLVKEHIIPELFQLVKENKSMPAAIPLYAAMFGPTMDNAHVYFAKIKKSLDAKNVCNPTRIMDISKFVDTTT